MRRPSPELVNCPACGVKNPAINDLCAACGKSLTVVIDPRPNVRHVGLGSVMIFIAVVAVCLAPVSFAPGLSIFLASLLVPTTVRGLIGLEWRRLDGHPADRYMTLALFVQSFFAVLWIAFATFIAFFATCFAVALATANPLRSGSPGFFAACGAGAISGLVALYVVGKKFWPDRS